MSSIDQFSAKQLGYKQFIFILVKVADILLQVLRSDSSLMLSADYPANSIGVYF